MMKMSSNMFSAVVLLFVVPLLTKGLNMSPQMLQVLAVVIEVSDLNKVIKLLLL